MIVDQVGAVLAHPLTEWEDEARNIAHVSPVRRILAGESGVDIFFSPAYKSVMIAGIAALPEIGWGSWRPCPSPNCSSGRVS